MLAKKNRLTREAFNQYFKKGKRVHGTYVQLIVSPSVVAHGSIVISKKVYSRAVDRNLLRRRIYTILRASFSNKPFVCIVIAKPSIKNVLFSEVKSEVESFLQKV